MFKRGKYEAAAPAAKAQKQTRKSNLLSAYITSLLCLMLCATMFLSTSMAWFTSEVENAGNQIYVGTLGVKLYHGGNEVKNGSAPILDNVMLSPDTHQVVELSVENTGNLPFNYRLAMTADYSAELGDAETIAANMKAMEAANHITVWVKAITNPGATFAYATAEADGWTKVGENLAEVLSGKVILSGQMGVASTADTTTEAERHSYAVALHMDANAPSSIMGATLADISVKLVAAQQVAGLTVVADAEELAEALAAGGNVLLLNDIDADADTTIRVAKGVTTNLYMNGHTIAGVSDQTGSNRNLLDVRGTLNVYDGTITVNHVGANMGWNNSTNVIHIEGGGVVNLKNTTIMNLGGSDMAFGVHMNNWGEVTLNADNSKIFSTYGAIRLFNSGNDKNNVTITNSTLIGKLAFWVHNYTEVDFGNKYDAEAVAARLTNINLLVEKPEAVTEVGDASNLNAAANNVIEGRILFGFTNGVDYYLTGKTPAVASDAEELASKLSAGGYVALADDIVLNNTSVTVPANVEATLDLAGHDISAVQMGTDGYGVFNVAAGATLNVVGDGDVKLTANVKSGISVAIFQNDGILNIYGGNYEAVQTESVKGLGAVIAVLDNCPYNSKAVANIYDGTFAVTGIGAVNVIRNWPIHADGEVTLNIYGGTFKANPTVSTTYLWNKDDSTKDTLNSFMNFYGGIFEKGVVYEDYNGQDDIYIAPGVIIEAYSENG